MKQYMKFENYNELQNAGLYSSSNTVQMNKICNTFTET